MPEREVVVCRAPKGYEFQFATVTLTSGGVKCEGACHPAWYSTPATAWTAWRQTLQQFTASRRVSYREEPELIHSPLGYVVRARLYV